MGATNDSSSPREVRVGLVQTAAGDNRAANVAQAVEGVRRAAAEGAHIVCLQELFASRYFCQREDPALFDLAEALDGPTLTEMRRAAREAKVTVVTPLFERRAPGVYHNSVLIVLEDGEVAGHYRKMHIPHDPRYYEKYYFTPGDSGFMAVPTPHARLGPLICWDQWYPEAARLTALRGAEILFYPTAIGWHCDTAGGLATSSAEREAELDAWETMQRSHAIANGVFVVAVNRLGREDELEFWGSSFVVDPFGRVLARASRSQAETLVVPCDLAAIEESRRLWPFLRDRRTDAYGGLTERFLEP